MGGPLIVAGVGIALLPDFIAADELASGAVVPILAAWSLPQTHLHLLSPPSRLRPARVRALADHLVDTLKIACAGAHAAHMAPHTSPGAHTSPLNIGRPTATSLG